MNRKPTLLITLAVILLIGLAFRLGSSPGERALAQEAGPDAGKDTLEAVNNVASRFTYQGLLQENGDPVTGTRNMTFRLYVQSNCTSYIGGSEITITGVPVNNGQFEVALDEDQSFFDGQELWLGVDIEGTPVGCHEITPVPYALSLRPGAVIDGGVAGNGLKVINSGSGGGVFGSSSTYGVYGLATSGSAGSAFGIYGQSQSTSGRGVYGTTTATSGVNYGVYGRSPSTSGMGVYGEAEAGSGTTYGVYGSSVSTNGRGVYGRVTAGSGDTYGVYGSSASTSGRGVVGLVTAGSGTTYGVYGSSASTSGRGVVGRATASSGTTYGVRGESLSSGGIGVIGLGTSSGGFAYGVMGQSNSSGGKGVYGTAAAASGTNYGVYGRSSSPDGYGVYATNATSDFFAPDLVLGGSVSQDNGNLFSDPALSSSDLLFFSNDEVWFYLDYNNDDTLSSFQIHVGGGSSNPVFKVEEDGDVFADGTYSSPAADFAELLPAAADLEPGDVLAISPKGILTRSTQAYQSSVVGVYSTRPGFLGGAVGGADDRGKAPLAMVGVVPVKASAENGPIQPGDLLTTSSTPGHAMRCEGVELCFGRSLGKAMEGLESGTGVIMMLVMLQ